MTRLWSTGYPCALLGRRSRYGAGGHSTTGTGPESAAQLTTTLSLGLPRAPSGRGGAGLSTPESAAHFLGAPKICPVGAAAGQGRA